MRLIQYDRWGGYIRDIQAVGPVMRTRDLDGTDQLEFATLADAAKGDRVVAVDSMGRVCEWEVSSVDAVREDGAPALDVACVAGYGELSLAWIDELQNTGYSAASCLEKALDGTRWTAGTCESGTLTSTATTSWYHESVSDALDDICDTYGLELEARYELDSTGTYVAARYIDLYEQRGGDNGKRFAYGKDLTGIRRTVGSTRPITRCYGYGKGVECVDEETGETTGGYSRKITFADVNDGYEYVDAGDEYLALWGVPGPDGEMLPACGVFEDGDCEDESVLLAETIAYLEEACEPSVSYTCDVAALGRAGMDAEGVDVGDTVLIIDSTFPTPLRLSGRVTRLVEDMAGGEPTEVTLGSVVDSLAAQASANAAALETVLSNSAAWNSAAAGSNVYISDLIARINELMNATGGYVYLTEDEGIYVYDLPIDESPTQCIHIGGGYWRCANSKTSAGEWDWQAMADGGGIYAGTLYTGTLSDAAGENWWNLDTGELSISAGSTIGDYTVSELTVAVEGITSTVESAVTEQVSALSATYLTADQLTEVLTDYVSGTSLADALAAYVTDDDLSDALDGYATVTYVTTNYSTTEQTATAITTTVAEELTAYATIEYSDAGDADALADAESYADSAVNSATDAITAAYTSAIEQTANSITSIVEAQTGSNLLQDGGFEAPDYWTGLQDGMYLDSDDPHSGTYCMACTGGYNIIYLNHPYGEDAATSKTPITVTPGRTYRVEAWVKASDDAVWASDNTKVCVSELDGSLVAALDTSADLVEAGGGWTYLLMEWSNDDREEVYVQLVQSVSSGTVWFDDVRVELDAVTTTELSSSIEQLADSVTTTVESYLYDASDDAVYALASEFEQTADSLTASLSSLSETVDGNWDTVTAYMSFTQDSDGDPLLVLGSSSSDASVELSNDRLSFMSGDEEVAYISDEELYISNVEVTGSLVIGGFVWEAMSDGSFQIRKADA